MTHKDLRTLYKLKLALDSAEPVLTPQPEDIIMQKCYQSVILDQTAKQPTASYVKTCGISEGTEVHKCAESHDPAEKQQERQAG